MPLPVLYLFTAFPFQLSILPLRRSLNLLRHQLPDILADRPLPFLGLILDPIPFHFGQPCADALGQILNVGHVDIVYTLTRCVSTVI